MKSVRRNITEYLNLQELNYESNCFTGVPSWAFKLSSEISRSKWHSIILKGKFQLYLMDWFYDGLVL